MKHYLICSILIVAVLATASAQYGALQGKILDSETGDGLPFAVLSLQKGETIVASTESDFDGNFNFSSIDAGTYDLYGTYVGYQPTQIKGMIIKTGEVLRYDVKLISANEIEEIVVHAEDFDPITCCAPDPHLEISSKVISKLPSRDVGAIMNMAANVNQKDDGEAVHFTSDRGSGVNTFVDGSLVIGSTGITDLDIEQVQVLTSGIPAEFGDATGGVVNIVTKGPASIFSGGFQAETSQFLDAFGYNRIDMNLSGPLVSRVVINDKGDTMRRDDGSIRRRSVLGFRFSGSFNTSLDSRPSALPSYQLKDEILQQLEASPLVRDQNGGLVPASDYLTADDIEKTAVRPNARQSSGFFNGKLEFRPSPEFFFVLGGQMQYDFGKTPSVMNRLFNSQYNPEYRNSTWRVNGRFRHTVIATMPDYKDEEPDENKLQPVFQNLSYELQADYTRTDFLQYDPRYRDRLFEYGYVGKIYRELAPVLGLIDSNLIINSVGDTLGVEPVLGHAAYQIVFKGFEADHDINPVLAAYNNLVDVNSISTMEELEIINGRFTGNRLSAFGLFNSPGQTGNADREGSAYAKSNNSQLRANVKANFDLVMARKSGNPVRHSIQMGGVYEQRIERSYNINPFSLWTLADQSANTHLSFATDTERPDGGMFFDEFTDREYATYDPLIRQDANGNLVSMTQFGERVREVLGKDQYDWVNVHELTPDQLNLSMFDATTLVQGRQRVLDYYGYDYLGNPLGSNVQFNDFFTAEDENGRKTRPVAPFKPIYVAGYLQDRFTVRDMIFNIGVRFEHYDANTKVLKDPYSIAGYYNAGEFFGSESPYNVPADFSRPANIGDDFAVYVSDNNPDASVVGYRDGEQWYNKEGIAVNNPSELGTIVVPALRGFGTSENDPQGENYNPDNAFRDYKPTLIVMPRISFSFPISKYASFYANYDVLAQRPPDGNFASALTYYNFREIAAAGNFIGNPNLKSQRSINYEVGFVQRINPFSTFKLAMMYREERNLIQIQQYVMAYPQTYTTFGNSDFSTFKSFVFEYNMRQHNRFNKNLNIIANYTLQFNDGTGSSPTSTANTSVQELKYVFPLDYDQRHAFFMNLDFRYMGGDRYNGPVVTNKKTGKRIKILQDMGLNASFNLNSGTPYTRRTVPGGIGTNFPNRITEGSINGARMPWNFRVDLRLDRDFVIAPRSKHPLSINVYIRIQNLLNTKNVLNVYPATGSPTDDGFLSMEGSPGLSLLANRPDSYQMLYNLRMNDPFNISRPRRIFLGMSVSF